MKKQSLTDFWSIKTFSEFWIFAEDETVNFDEIDFRSKRIKKQKIIISIEIKEHYQISSENRKSLIIIERINQSKNFFFHSWSSFRDKI
jgi:hypothetical protein